MSDSHHDDSPTTRFPRIDVPPHQGTGGEPVPPAPEDRRPANPTLLEQMGGVPGIVASTVPVVVFVLVNVLTELRTALYAALAAGVAVLIWRLVRRDPIQPAVSGLFGVGICALVANQTGEARGFYLPGLLYSAFLGVAALVSMVVRWPLAGVIWHGINGRGTQWRQDPRLLRAYGWATGVWATVFLAKVLVQGGLYLANSATWLGVARLAMGYPLTAVAILATVLIVRGAERP